MRTRVWRRPLLWTAFDHSASPAVNVPSEDSISGVQLCPQALVLKKSITSFPFHKMTTNLTSLTLQIHCDFTNVQRLLLGGIIDTQNCVKDMFPLLLSWIFFLFSPSKYESQNHFQTLHPADVYVGLISDRLKISTSSGGKKPVVLANEQAGKKNWKYNPAQRWNSNKKSKTK